MAAGDEEQNKRENRGFAALSSLVSDVDTSAPPAAKHKPQAMDISGASSSAERPKVIESAQPEPQPKQQQPNQAPSQPSSGSSSGKWLLGIAVVIGGLWLIGEADKSPSSPVPSYSQSAANPAQSYSAALARPQVQSRPDEAKPPVGRDLVFSTAQIRYCLAEDIRMDGAKSALNNYSDSDVDRFNAMVADYNSRCGSFRYRSGALENARRDIEPYRSQLQVEGRSRFARSPSTGSLSAPAPAPAQSRPAPDLTVQSIQRRLNELGYNAGSADGLMGRGTRSAIIEFQQDRGVAATGIVDQALLLQLQEASPKADAPKGRVLTKAPVSSSAGSQKPSAPANSWVAGSNWYCNDGYRKVGEKCETLHAPANSWVVGSNWYCNDGYRKVGDKCEKLHVPANAWVSGSSWYCNDGYRKVGDKCEKLHVPANAWVSGSSWYCNDGYRKVGNKCEKLHVPANAWVSGSNWYCNDGYRKVGDKCISNFQK